MRQRKEKKEKVKKIEIKLKECCLTCEHFDPSGCIGLSIATICCGEGERVIACGHIAVCSKYNEADKEENNSEWIALDLTPDIDKSEPSKHVGFRDTAYQCRKCSEIVKEKTEFCPHCGRKNIRNEI